MKQEKNICLKEIQFLRNENKQLASNIKSAKETTQFKSILKGQSESVTNQQNGKENQNIILKECKILNSDLQDIVIPESSKENSPEKTQKVQLNFKVSTGSLIPRNSNLRSSLEKVDENIDLEVEALKI